MKIYSKIQQDAFVLFLDTEKTGNPEKDTVNCAMRLEDIKDYKQPDEMLSILVPMISELVYKAYGDPVVRTTPLTDWHATGFDRNYTNGVKI